MKIRCYFITFYSFVVFIYSSVAMLRDQIKRYVNLYIDRIEFFVMILVSGQIWSWGISSIQNDPTMIRISFVYPSLYCPICSSIFKTNKMYIWGCLAKLIAEHVFPRFSLFFVVIDWLLFQMRRHASWCLDNWIWIPTSERSTLCFWGNIWYLSLLLSLYLAKISFKTYFKTVFSYHQVNAKAFTTHS